MNQIINLRNEIESRYNLIQLIEEKTKDALNQLPEGRIKIKKRDQDTNYYLVVGDNKEKWLKKDNKELIESLIQKNYLQKVNRAAEKEIEKLDETQQNAVVMFVRFLLSQGANGGGGIHEVANDDSLAREKVRGKAKMRELGGFEKGFYIAPDFDEPLDDFAEYM